MEKSQNYRQARITRSRSLGDLISRNLIEDKSLGSSISGAISEKFKAKVTGVKEKFDPLNIARGLTGNVGATLFGKMTGRSKGDISYFTGIISSKRNQDPLYTKISEGQSQRMRRGDAIADVLAKLYNLTKTYHEEDVLHMQMEKNFKEERQAEKEKWQNELLKAITGLGKNLRPTAEKEPEEEKKPTFIDNISDATQKKIEESVMKKIMDRFAGIGIITGGAVGGALLAIAGVYAAVRENQRVKDEIDKDPNAPGLEDNMYAMTRRGEAKDFRGASKRNTEKAVKQMTPKVVKEFIESKLTDDELKSETGKNRAELQDWLQQNPKGMLKVDTSLRPGQAVIAEDEAYKAEQKRLAEIEIKQTPDKAAFGRFPSMKTARPAESTKTSPIPEKQEPAKTATQTNVKTTAIPVVQEPVKTTATPVVEPEKKEDDMKSEKTVSAPVAPIPNELTNKMQEVISRNNDLKLDESVAGQTIVIDNSKSINNTVPGDETISQPGSIPVRNEDDSFNMCLRKNYRPV